MGNTTGNTLTIGIVGGGTMGAGIADVAAAAGHDVIVRSRQATTAAAVHDTIAGWIDQRVERGRLSPDDAAARLQRVTTTDQLDALHSCDLVVENVVEDLGVKRQVFADLAAATKPETVLATNTSTLPVVELAIASGRPEQVCGIHFFNPPQQLRLVEIVRPLTASDETMAAATSFAESCGKQTIAVADRAGFVVNALLFAYLNDAVRMHERGTASIADIDAAMCGGCNFPLGPFALLDLVGLDTSVRILDALHGDSGEPRHAAATTLRRLVAAGRLGRKSGAGFYNY